MFIIFLLLTAAFIFHSIAYIDNISFNSVPDSPIDTSNAINNKANTEQKQIRIFQQGMFSLNRSLTPTLIAQDHVISLEIAGNYIFNNFSKTVTIEKSTFTGTLFGIENLAAMHEPQIQMMLDNIHNFTVSSDLRMINYDVTFVDQNLGANLTATVSAILRFQNPIAFDELLDRQDAIPDSSIMNVTLGAIFLKPVIPGMEIYEISIN